MDALPALSDSPPRAAVAVARTDRGRLVVIGPDGGLWRADDPRLASATFAATSLSPDGTWAALTRGSRVVLLDVTSGRVRQIVTGSEQPSTPVVAWLDADTLILPGRGGAVLVDAATGEVRHVDAMAADVVTVRGNATPPLAELVTAAPEGVTPAGAPETRSLIRTSLNPGLPRDGEPATATATVRRVVIGPPWLRSWTGAGWASPLFYVRACVPAGLDLPDTIGAASAAVAALEADGYHLATLVAVDGGRLDVLGFHYLSPGDVLVAVRADDATTLVTWTPDAGRLSLVMAVDADTEISVADLLRRDWVATIA